MVQEWAAVVDGTTEWTNLGQNFSYEWHIETEDTIGMCKNEKESEIIY